jgi:hypothetical protein
MVRSSVRVVGRPEGLATPRWRGGVRSVLEGAGGLAVPRLWGGCWSMVEQARGLRAFVIAHVRLEIRRTADPVEAGLLGRALAEVVWTARDPQWWTARHLDGAIAAVHQRCEELAGRAGSAGKRDAR